MRIEKWLGSSYARPLCPDMLILYVKFILSGRIHASPFLHVACLSANNWGRINWEFQGSGGDASMPLSLPEVISSSRQINLAQVSKYICINETVFVFVLGAECGLPSIIIHTSTSDPLAPC